MKKTQQFQYTEERILLNQAKAIQILITSFFILFIALLVLISLFALLKYTWYIKPTIIVSLALLTAFIMGYPWLYKMELHLYFTAHHSYKIPFIILLSFVLMLVIFCINLILFNPDGDWKWDDYFFIIVAFILPFSYGIANTIKNTFFMVIQILSGIDPDQQILKEEYLEKLKIAIYSCKRYEDSFSLSSLAVVPDASADASACIPRKEITKLAELLRVEINKELRVTDAVGIIDESVLSLLFRQTAIAEARKALLRILDIIKNDAVIQKVLLKYHCTLIHSLIGSQSFVEEKHTDYQTILEEAYKALPEHKSLSKK